MSEPKRLTRDPEHGIVGGVATGMAHYFDVDPVLMRVIFVLVILFTVGTGILAYIILWILIPRGPAQPPRAASGP